MAKAVRRFVQGKIEFIEKCYDTVSSIQYDGSGSIKIEGKGARTTPYRAYMGNAQLASNLAKAISEDYDVAFEKVEYIEEYAS